MTSTYYGLNSLQMQVPVRDNSAHKAMSEYLPWALQFIAGTIALQTLNLTISFMAKLSISLLY